MSIYKDVTGTLDPGETAGMTAEQIALNQQMAARWQPVSLLQGDLLLLAQRALDGRTSHGAACCALGAALEAVTPHTNLGRLSPLDFDGWHVLHTTYITEQTAPAVVLSASFLLSNALQVGEKWIAFSIREGAVVPISVGEGVPTEVAVKLEAPSAP
jgi:hypothetical protein